MWNFATTMDADRLAANLHLYVRSDSGMPIIVWSGREQERSGAALSRRAEKDEANPAARDFDSIAETLPSNARSDGGNGPIVVLNDGAGNSVDSGDVRPRPGIAEDVAGPN
jgi:hypothetical protein